MVSPTRCGTETSPWRASAAPPEPLTKTRTSIVVPTRSDAAAGGAPSRVQLEKRRHADAEKRARQRRRSRPVRSRQSIPAVILRVPRAIPTRLLRVWRRSVAFSATSVRQVPTAQVPRPSPAFDRRLPGSSRPQARRLARLIAQQPDQCAARRSPREGVRWRRRRLTKTWPRLRCRSPCGRAGRTRS